jgi:hypothetical protein
MNPNTGEIRGASVFFPVGFVRGVPPAPAAMTGDAAPPAPGLRWGTMKRQSLCERALPSLDDLMADEPSPGTAALTHAERVERYLTSIVAHEIGHTLGLQHNFKGSMRPLSSSLMDYLVAEDDITLAGQPQSYDIAALRYLYGLSPDLPGEPFCTDEHRTTDPDCRTFDRGANPFSEWVAPRYTSAAQSFLSGRTTSFVISQGDGVIQYVRQGQLPDGRRLAWEALIAPLKTPLAVPPDAPPNFAARVSAVTRVVLSRLFLPVERTLPFPGHPPLPPIPAPPLHPTLVPAAVAELGANLLDVDQLRTFTLRRLAADILKRMQRLEALAVLTQARDQLAEQIPTLPPEVALETQDLLNRVQRHLTAYFD